MGRKSIFQRAIVFLRFIDLKIIPGQRRLREYIFVAPAVVAFMNSRNPTAYVICTRPDRASTVATHPAAFRNVAH